MVSDSSRLPIYRTCTTVKVSDKDR